MKSDHGAATRSYIKLQSAGLRIAGLGLGADEFHLDYRGGRQSGVVKRRSW